MIEIKNISFSFGKDKIISDLNLEIEEGKTYCIMGKSGVGKTTLMKLIAGLLKPEKGEILGTEKLKKSFIFQENRLLPGLSVYENIKFVTADEEKITNALQDTSLLSEKNKMIDELSGGMARRVAIARIAKPFTFLFLPFHAFFLAFLIIPSWFMVPQPIPQASQGNPWVLFI